MSGGLPVLVARDLAVEGPGGPLLAASSFELRAGERALLVGPSGSGKSLFLDLLLGFLPDPGSPLRVLGSLTLDGDELLGQPPAARAGRVGAVLQLHALGLFDDLRARQNLRFGSLDARAAEATAAALGLDGLERPVPALSGGERVRLALARTLLAGPDVLVADEPTTGLDPAAAAQAVEALRTAHRRLTLVVTHDAASFEGFADAVLVLEPSTRRLVRLAPSDPWPSFPRALPDPRPAGARGPGPADPVERARPLRRLGAGMLGRADATGQALADVGSLALLPRAALDLGHPLHGPRVRAALRRCLAPGVAAFVGVSAVLVALTATFFLFEKLPRRDFAEPLLQDDLLSGLGQVLARVVVPLVVSILLAAKLGASAAAHLGHLSLTRQVDALRLLGVSLRRHLLAPVALGQLLAAWAGTALAVLLAYAATSAVFLWQHPGWSGLYVRRAWFHALHPQDALWEAGKVGLSALLVAATAFRSATATRKRAPHDVLASIHRTLLVGLLLVLAVIAAFAFVEF